MFWWRFRTAWRASNFNDNSWAQGPAQLGYGDGDEDTEVGFVGGNNNKKSPVEIKAGRQCHNCGEKGHYKHECPQAQDEEQEGVEQLNFEEFEQHEEGDDLGIEMMNIELEEEPEVEDPEDLAPEVDDPEHVRRRVRDRHDRGQCHDRQQRPALRGGSSRMRATTAPASAPPRCPRPSHEPRSRHAPRGTAST